MSLSVQRPFKLRLPSMVSPDPAANDWEWSSKATHICGKVQDFVFGDGVANNEEYQRLMREIDAWKTSKPAAFDPVHQVASTGPGSFPNIFLHLDCHGEQFCTWPFSS